MQISRTLPCWVRKILTIGTASFLFASINGWTNESHNISFSELAQYFEEHGLGALQARGCNSDQTDRTCPSFSLKQEYARLKWNPSEPWSDEELQSLFQFDSRVWKEQLGAIDFLEAKERYYSSLPVHSSSTHYELPFITLRGWGSLAHPPIKELHEPLPHYSQALSSPIPLSEEHPYFKEEFQRNLDRLTGTELTAGNTLKILSDGPEAFQHKLRMIQNAKRFLWVQVMVFSCDSQTSPLVEALIQKKKQGVDVRVMVEELWTRIAYNACYQRMRRAGIPIALVADSVNRKSITGVMHSKIWIRDGEEGIIGGRNMLASEQTGNGFNPDYRDTDVWIEKGPSVTDLMAAYLKTWRKHVRIKANNAFLDQIGDEVETRKASERRTELRGVSVYRDTLKDPNRRMKGVCRVVSQGQGAVENPISPLIIELTKKARSLVWMTSPNIRFSKSLTGRKIPTDLLFQELILASKERNIRVDLLTNGIDGLAGDWTKIPRKLEDKAKDLGLEDWESLFHRISFRLASVKTRKNNHFVRALLNYAPSIHVWEYFRYTHQKVHFFDRLLVGVGSFNLDEYSSYANHEAAIFCLDEKLARDTERMMIRDFINSVPAPRN